MECGPEGAFDRVLAYPSHNPPGRVKGKLQFFYTGGGVKNHPRKGVPMAMGLMTISLDRFAGLAHWRNLPPGRLLTKPLTIPHPHLAVNVEYVEHSPMRLEVRQPDGKVIPGFALEDSKIEVDPARIYSWARWRKKADLSELVGRKVVLHYEVSGAVLYSYRFHPRRADAVG